MIFPNKNFSCRLLFPEIIQIEFCFYSISMEPLGKVKNSFSAMRELLYQGVVFEKITICLIAEIISVNNFIFACAFICRMWIFSVRHSLVSKAIVN